MERLFVKLRMYDWCREAAHLTGGGGKILIANRLQIYLYNIDSFFHINYKNTKIS